jgi:hypothetical protein
LLKKLVVDADAGARLDRRDDAVVGARRSKTVVANAGARWKKRGRRGVDVAELFVRIFGNNDDRKRNWYLNDVPEESKMEALSRPRTEALAEVLISSYTLEL